ncbi:hypothetical protein [Streptomyces sp. NBC_00687]|uniref:hypothetical protein n=1 Tax=Streptomyces sp. NBC_00687 TaxID=2975807 RepID=UPI00224DF6E2|nr:hypothetical protein [Streptomyces sp. NBC_00687]MCX4915318.1 hypothetical protein [Streptomyces sp. NBC_00687]
MTFHPVEEPITEPVAKLGGEPRLRAPITGFLCWDRGFEDKFRTIGRWWQEHRGPDWAPVLLPGAHVSGPPLLDGNPFASPTQ